MSATVVDIGGSASTGFRYTVGPSGIESAQRHFGLFEGGPSYRATYDGEYVIGGGGDAVDPTTMARVGRCRPTELPPITFLHAAVGSADTNRIYGAVGGVPDLHGITSIVACDRTTFTEVAQIPVPAILGHTTLMAIRPGVGLVLLVRRDEGNSIPGRIVFVDTNMVALAP